jgi:hypothetical protein
VTTRRRILLAGVALAVTGTSSAGGAGVSLVDLSMLGKALGDAADAVGKLGDSFAHLVSLGQQGWDAASARATRNRLRDISARLTILSQQQNVRVIVSLDEYIREAQNGLSTNLLQTAWSQLLSHLTDTLRDVKALLGDLEQERSDLVTQTVYQDLIETLGSRVKNQCAGVRGHRPPRFDGLATRTTVPFNRDDACCPRRVNSR